jgi:hypothetical protein
MDTPQSQPAPVMLGAPQVDLSALCWVLSLRSEGVCLAPTIVIDGSDSGFTATYGIGQGTLQQWVPSSQPGIAVEMVYVITVSDGASIVLGTESLTGSTTYNFSGTVAITDSAVIVSIGIKVDEGFDMEVAGVEVQSTSGTIVWSLATYTYNYTIDGSNNATVTLAEPVLSETGLPLGQSTLCPCPMPPYQVYGLQEQARAALIALGGDIADQLSGLLEGYGGGPFNPP